MKPSPKQFIASQKLTPNPKNVSGCNVAFIIVFTPNPIKRIRNTHTLGLEHVRYLRSGIEPD